MFSPMNQMTIAPTAKADRLINMPKNKPMEKNPKSLTKKATKNSRSENTIENSL